MQSMYYRSLYRYQLLSMCLTFSNLYIKMPLAVYLSFFTLYLPVTKKPPSCRVCMQMCQHVRGRRAGSSQRGDRETRVSLRVSGCGPFQLHDVNIIIVDVDGTPSTTSIVISLWWPDREKRHDVDDRRYDKHGVDDYIREDQQRRRGRGRCRRGRLTSEEETRTEDACQIGEPWRYPGGLYDRVADPWIFPGSTDDGGKRDDHGSTVGAEEAGSPESLQPGSSGGRDARPVSRNGTSSRRLQNGLYPAAGSQGRQQQATDCRQDAFLSRPFPSGVQV